MVQLIDVQDFDPPRRVLVELDGQWWPGFQFSWQLLDDDRGWMADVEFTAQHEWGQGKYRPMVPAERVRLHDDQQPVDNVRAVDDSGRRSPVV